MGLLLARERLSKSMKSKPWHLGMKAGPALPALPGAREKSPLPCFFGVLWGVSPTLGGDVRHRTQDAEHGSPKRRRICAL